MEEILASGTIRGPEAGGKAQLVRTANGDSLTLKDYWIAPGAPDVHVYLSPDKAGSVTVEGIVDFGRITQLGGEISYEIPEDYPTETVQSVIVHCTQFSVTFGVAELEHA